MNTLYNMVRVRGKNIYWKQSNEVKEGDIVSINYHFEMSMLGKLLHIEITESSDKLVKGSIRGAGSKVVKTFDVILHKNEHVVLYDDEEYESSYFLSPNLIKRIGIEEYMNMKVD